MNAETQVNEFVAVTLLAAITYSDKEDLYEFTEIDDDYCFGICEDIDIEALYVEERMEKFTEWHKKANTIFLEKRNELIGELE